jgi:hypothetical protein
MWAWGQTKVKHLRPVLVGRAVLKVLTVYSSPLHFRFESTEKKKLDVAKNIQKIKEYPRRSKNQSWKKKRCRFSMFVFDVLAKFALDRPSPPPS